MSNIKIPVLSQSDIRELRFYLERLRRLTINTSGRNPPELENNESPEVYIARTPAAGIPALDLNTTGTGTGTLSDDAPGYADCYVYRVLNTDGNFNLPVIKPVTGLWRRLLNLSSNTISGGKWVIALRDKFGHWFAIPIAVSKPSYRYRCEASGVGTSTQGNLKEYLVNDDESETFVRIVGCCDTDCVPNVATLSFVSGSSDKSVSLSEIEIAAPEVFAGELVVIGAVIKLSSYDTAFDITYPASWTCNILTCNYYKSVVGNGSFVTILAARTIHANYSTIPGQVIRITPTNLQTITEYAVNVYKASTFPTFLSSGFPAASGGASGTGTNPKYTGATIGANTYTYALVGTNGPSEDSDGTWITGFTDNGQDKGTTGGGATSNYRLCDGKRSSNDTYSGNIEKTGMTSRDWIMQFASFTFTP